VSGEALVPLVPVVWQEEVEGPPLRESFGVRDRFGREIGAYATLSTVRVSLDPAPSKYGGRVAGGLYVPGATVYRYDTMALRDGRGFGPSGRGGSFATKEERAAAVRLYFAGARKRALSGRAGGGR
jgi:hypothetical protein